MYVQIWWSIRVQTIIVQLAGSKASVTLRLDSQVCILPFLVQVDGIDVPVYIPVTFPGM